MNYKIISISFICLLLLFSTSASSKSNFVNIEYYYNDHLVTNSDSPETPKPLLKIGEPFKIRFEVTCYKRNYLSAKLLSIGNNDFDILEGPTLTLGTGTRETIGANETRVFEWVVAPNEEWAGGSSPIDFYYQMTDLDTVETIANGRFTAAYVTISDEYYDGPEYVPSSESQSNASSSNSTPGFTMLVASLAMLGVTLTKRMIR
jgi:sarcinarray family protein